LVNIHFVNLGVGELVLELIGFFYYCLGCGKILWALHLLENIILCILAAFGCSGFGCLAIITPFTLDPSVASLSDQAFVPAYLPVLMLVFPVPMMNNPQMTPPSFPAGSAPTSRTSSPWPSAHPASA
jgi:hypothetical protein